MSQVDLDSAILARLANGTLRVDLERGLVYTTSHIGRKGRPLDKPLGTLNPDGYLSTSFQYEKRRYDARIHRIVWMAAHGRRVPDGLVLDHIDRCRTNNSISNLRAVTMKENSQNGIQIGETAFLAKLSTAQVQDIRGRRAAGEKARTIAEDHGILLRSVYRIAKFKSRRCG